MTNSKAHLSSIAKRRDKIISLCLMCFTVFFGLALSGESAEYVKSGMKLAVECVIPSSFPFMIISDIYVAYGRPENLRMLGSVFGTLFGLPRSCLGAFICGNIGGFPIGAKMCADAYTSGQLSRADAQRLMPLCNNPSCAFIIGGVGMGMWGDIKIGFLLLFSVFSASVICGVVLRKKRVENDITSDNVGQKYDFVESVKKSGYNSISIISFICLFSVVCGIIKKRIKNAFLLCPVFSILEVTNAVSALCDMDAFPIPIRLALCSFALGFGGICVGMQSSVFTLPAGLGMKKYYLVKLLEGVLSASITSLLYFI